MAVTSDKEPTVVDGQTFKKGDILICGAKQFSRDMDVEGTTAHEIQHQKFQAVLDKHGERLRPILVDDKNPMHQQLQKDDGVTSYSTSYWIRHGAVKTPESYVLAVHETLAEIARLDFLGHIEPDTVKPTWRKFADTVNALYKAGK